MFSCEYFEIFKNSFFYKTRPVVASVKRVKIICFLNKILKRNICGRILYLFESNNMSFTIWRILLLFSFRNTNFTPGKVLFNIHTFFLGLTSLILLFKDRGDSLQFLRDHSKMTSPKNSYFRAPSPLLLLVTNVSNALPPLLLKNNKLSLEKPPVSCMFITQ